MSTMRRRGHELCRLFFMETSMGELRHIKPDPNKCRIIVTYDPKNPNDLLVYDEGFVSDLEIVGALDIAKLAIIERGNHAPAEAEDSSDEVPD